MDKCLLTHPCLYPPPPHPSISLKEARKRGKKETKRNLSKPNEEDTIYEKKTVSGPYEKETCPYAHRKKEKIVKSRPIPVMVKKSTPCGGEMRKRRKLMGIARGEVGRWKPNAQSRFCRWWWLFNTTGGCASSERCIKGRSGM